jgi:hypothetical protein
MGGEWQLTISKPEHKVNWSTLTAMTVRSLLQGNCTVRSALQRPPTTSLSSFEHLIVFFLTLSLAIRITQIL